MCPNHHKLLFFPTCIFFGFFVRAERGRDTHASPPIKHCPGVPEFVSHTHCHTHTLTGPHKQPSHLLSHQPGAPAAPSSSSDTSICFSTWPFAVLSATARKPWADVWRQFLAVPLVSEWLRTLYIWPPPWPPIPLLLQISLFVQRVAAAAAVGGVDRMKGWVDVMPDTHIYLPPEHGVCWLLTQPGRTRLHTRPFS